MTTSPATVDATTAPPDMSKTWLDYRSVWRWHFYAGLLVIPFLIYNALAFTIYAGNPARWADQVLTIPMVSGVSWSLTSGDIDGDTVPDLVIGDISDSNRTGAVHVVSGAAVQVLLGL